MAIDQSHALLEKLNIIYGNEKAPAILEQIKQMLDRYALQKTKDKRWVSEKDVMLITYGDSIRSEDETPLQSLRKFLLRNCQGMLSSVHILPFYPYSSDDGFSVIDYREVNPQLGNWDDVTALSHDFDLMFDGVINHISQHSDWFQQYLLGNPDYANYFVEADPDADYSSVTRPRALPLLTKFQTPAGEKHIWTTFSDDQIDLNFASEKVLLEIVEILLMYAARGARYLRLDAIGFMWKKLGTTCMHLEETHAIVQVIREVLETAVPDIVIITETNVPHHDNISYFGNGSNEAHMVYQFPLPPLTLHTLHTGNSSKLQAWADSLGSTTQETSFFNFLASHDGIGVRPVEGILSKEEVNTMALKVQEHGGFVSYKNNGDGTKSPYELNINYLNALSHPDEAIALKVKRVVAAHSILLSFMGMPAIYVHSLLGSQNDQEGVKATGRYRSINREQLLHDQLQLELDTEGSLREQVFQALRKLIQIRVMQPSFHPNASQRILTSDSQLFALLRTASQNGELLAIVNITNETVQQDFAALQTGWKHGEMVFDLISEQNIHIEDSLQLTLAPYQVMWIKRLEGGDDK
ncbi:MULTISPECIES: sugar phosphorylase [unclassified Paenibacillus]|uniref:sugar phosphorylase n=1 Tax=unclassified Paenibacillus TaxID=185978 RepID=UPI000708CFE0|nr:MULTISPECIES: sugar phosphorylase [unclassified Paenibacillus]KQX55296.1 sugar phosphorylase [Paenibacillus sp. Root444D2]KRE41223.1 sugar phosphorylase [Paenibacillus sp. Soil724D2]